MRVSFCVDCLAQDQSLEPPIAFNVSRYSTHPFCLSSVDLFIYQCTWPKVGAGVRPTCANWS